MYMPELDTAYFDPVLSGIQKGELGGLVIGTWATEDTVGF